MTKKTSIESIQNFLSPFRMREWHDVHRQLKQLICCDHSGVLDLPQLAKDPPQFINILGEVSSRLQAGRLAQQQLTERRQLTVAHVLIN